MTDDDIKALAADLSAYRDATVTLRGDAVVEFARRVQAACADVAESWDDYGVSLNSIGPKIARKIRGTA
jgi:hypothetical protein